MNQNNIISYLKTLQKAHCSSMLQYLLGMLLVVCCNAVYAQDMDFSDSDSNVSDSDAMAEMYDSDNGFDINKEHSPIGIRYTKKHPLVIVGNWLFRPFSFINDHGEPDGFQVELVKNIFSNLHVPYEIRLMNWQKAKRMVRKGEANLMVCIDKNDVSTHTGYSHSVLAEYNIGIARNVKTPRLRSILLLHETDTVYIMKGDYVDSYFRQYYGNSIPFHIEYSQAEDALNNIVSGKVKYFVWGKNTLKSLVNRYDLTKVIKVDDIDVPAGKMRFFSNDSILLHDLDVQFQRIKASGAYESLENKWFVKDGKQEKETDIVEIILNVVIVVLFVILFILIVIMKRSGNVEILKKEFQAISRISLSMTKCHVIVVDLKKMRVKSIFGDLLPKGGVSMREYEQIIHPDDITKEYEARKMVDAGEVNMPNITLRVRRHGAKEDDWRVMNIYALVRKDSKDRPHHLYLVMTDQTDHLTEQHKLNNALDEFANIADISTMGVVYYDVTGQYVNSNRQLLRLLDQNRLNRAQQYIEKSTLTDIALILNGIVIEGERNDWFCASIDIPELSLKTTVEVRIQSIHDANGVIKGYSIGMEDVNNKIQLIRELYSVDRNLVEAKNLFAKYHAELQFIMNRNKMSTFRWQVGKDYFEISHNLLSYDHKNSFKDSFNSMVLEDKQTIVSAIRNPEAYFSKPQNNLFCFRQESNGEAFKWYKIFTTPEYDEQGNLIGAFGLRCDVTDFMLSQESLRDETEKAKNSGRLKTLFLANMTHELRTPLNAINGFAEVMQFIDSSEDKSGYVDIMKHNCNMLINLIDNILQVSMMDTEGIRLRKRDVNFSHFFPLTVAEMMKYVTSTEVQFQMDTPLKDLIVYVDYDHLMQILEAFVNNASKFTQKGFIRVGYRYYDGYLTVYCRDTGCGIPKEKQKDIFNRFTKLNDFVQGTGLGLAVSKMIADAMGGKIDLYSREGEGSNFSFTIQC